MTEYIERDKAIDYLMEIIDRPNHPEWLWTDEICDSLNTIPAADVRPVVLCKDCVYSDKWYANRLICCLWNEHDGNSVFEDGFCNYGVKREES